MDEMEVDESGVLDLMSLLAGEFQRTRVVPVTLPPEQDCEAGRQGSPKRIYSGG